MKTAIDFDAITIDGNKLREAREARNLSIAELAALVTLSREQVKHIEEGGDRPFYTPAHKLLAVRKYAAAMDLPYDDIVTGAGADQTVPAPEHAPVSMMTPQPEGIEPADLRLAAVERNAEIRRLVLIGAVTLTILLAIYAKVRGAKSDISEQDAESAYATAIEPEPAPAPKPPAAAANTAKPDAPADLARATEPAGSCPVRAVSGDTPSWSPAYQYKADLRLFVISAREGSLCVRDATGKETLLAIKPMTWQVVAGKPPYEVRAAQLADHKLYLQGQLVKIPADAVALRLVPTQTLPPAPVAAPAPAPAADPASSPAPSAAPTSAPNPDA